MKKLLLASVHMLHVFGFAVVITTSLPSHAREPLPEEGTIFSEMDFPEGRPFWNRSNLEKERITQLWDEAKESRKFTLIRTFRNEAKNKTAYSFLSEPVPVNPRAFKYLAVQPPQQGPGQWFEYWQKNTSAYDDPQKRAASDTLASGAYRFIMRCSPASMVEVATLFFESTDASGPPKSIFQKYSRPTIKEGQELREGLWADLYKVICGETEKNSEPALPTKVEKPVQAVRRDSGESSGPARLRLFGQNGVNVKYYPNSACRGGESVSVSGGIGDAFSSFIGTAKNASIGMPASPNTENQSTRDGMLSKAYYREYEVTPGQPITITMHFQSNPGKRYMHCTTVATSFVPEPGKNYEGTFEIKDGICLQVINELESTSEGIMLNPVDVAAAPVCS